MRKQKCGQEAAWQGSPYWSGAATFAPPVLGAHGADSVTPRAPCTRARPARRSCWRAGSHVEQRRVWSTAPGGCAPGAGGCDAECGLEPCIADRQPLDAVLYVLAVHANKALSGPEAQAAGAPAHAQQRSPCPELTAPSARWVAAWLGARVARAHGAGRIGLCLGRNRNTLARSKAEAERPARPLAAVACSLRTTSRPSRRRCAYAPRKPATGRDPFQTCLTARSAVAGLTARAQAADAVGCRAQGLKI